MKRAVVITIEELPHRASGLTEDALSKVFGGCHKSWGSCRRNRDCCYGFSCNPWGKCALVGGSPF